MCMRKGEREMSAEAERQGTRNEWSCLREKESEKLKEAARIISENTNRSASMTSFHFLVSRTLFEALEALQEKKNRRRTSAGWYAGCFSLSAHYDRRPDERHPLASSPPSSSVLESETMNGFAGSIPAEGDLPSTRDARPSTQRLLDMHAHVHLLGSMADACNVE